MASPTHWGLSANDNPDPLAADDLTQWEQAGQTDYGVFGGEYVGATRAKPLQAECRA